MGYHMHYLVADEQPVTVNDIETFFAGLGADYATEPGDDEIVVNHAGEPIDGTPCQERFGTRGDPHASRAAAHRALTERSPEAPRRS